MNKAIFKSIAQEQLTNREVQKYKFNFSYAISSIINAATTTPFTLAIEQDADFLIIQMTGSVYGPVAAVTGLPVVAATDFPMPGIGIGAGHAGRGITFQIIDTGAGRELTNAQVPAENLLTPGYGQQMFLPYPIRYFAKRNSKIKYNFANRDTQARHQVDILLNGFKFQMPEFKKQLDINDILLDENKAVSR